MKEKESCNLLSKIKILEELGYDLKPESMVLDFGCGEGKAVHEWRDHGYQAFGCDIKLRNKVIIQRNFRFYYYLFGKFRQFAIKQKLQCLT